MIRRDSMTREQSAFVEDYFHREVFPVLTPMAVDASHRFPLVLSRSLNIAVLLAGRNGKKDDFATVQVPSVLPRVVWVPGDNATTYTLLEEVVLRHLGELFPGRTILAASPYRITRNADLTYDEEEVADLLKEIKKSLKKLMVFFADVRDIDQIGRAHV